MPASQMIKLSCYDSTSELQIFVITEAYGMGDLFGKTQLLIALEVVWI
jgi:hypothetical protein